MANVFGNLNISILTDALLRIIPVLLCLTLHELAHGFVAYKLGDNTAKDMGRLTLNPIKHIDPIGLLMMILFRFGWAKPVMIDMRNFENPKRGMALCAFAGPLMNILLAAFLLIVYGIVFAFMPDTGRSGWAFALQMIVSTAMLSCGLAVFNLIPIPPLDGSKVLFSFLSDEMYAKLMRIERYGGIILMALIWSGALDTVLATAVTWVFDKLFVISDVVYNIVYPLVS